MKTVYTLYILVLLHLATCHRTKAAETSKQMPIKEILRLIYKDKATIDEETKQASKAEALYQKNTKGRDETEVALATGEVQVRIIYKFAGPNDDNRQDLMKLPYIINDKMLYFMDDATSYRGVNSGIDLASIVGKADDPMNGQCCERVEKVDHVKIEIYEFKGYCFHLDMMTEDYMFCDEKKDKIDGFRQKLIAYAMNAYFIKLGIDQPTFVQDQGLACLNPEFNFSLEDQASWPCECNKGLKQSPLDLEQSQATLKEDDRLRMEFKDAVAIRYGVVRREPEFHGDFGMFSHISPEKTIEYHAHKIVFKVPKSEHLLLDLEVMQQVKGELLVYATSKNMEKAILSILFMTPEDEGRINDFMNDMNLDSWEYENFNEIDENGLPVLKCLKYNEKPKEEGSEIIEYYYPNLKNFINSGKQLSEELSFFWYQGSDTKPPCDQQYTRYVLKYPAKMDVETFNKLKAKVLVDAEIEPVAKANTRVVQNRLDRDIFFHNANHCPNIPKPRPVEPEVDYKFVKATQKVTTYAMADGKFPVNDVFMYHAKKDNQDLIEVNKNLKLTKFKREPFKEDAGEENIEKLKTKWMRNYGRINNYYKVALPDPMEQQQLFKEALEKAGIDPQQIEKKDEKKDKKEFRFKKYRLRK